VPEASCSCSIARSGLRFGSNKVQMSSMSQTRFGDLVHDHRYATAFTPGDGVRADSLAPKFFFTSDPFGKAAVSKANMSRWRLPRLVWVPTLPLEVIA
jgi:hypothetical protein